MYEPIAASRAIKLSNLRLLLPVILNFFSNWTVKASLSQSIGGRKATGTARKLGWLVRPWPFGR